MKRFVAVLCGASVVMAQAVQIEQEPPEMYTQADVPVISFDGNHFSFFELPAAMADLTVSDDKAGNEELLRSVNLGEAPTLQEVQRVLKAYYAKNAFDSASIRIRGLEIGRRGYYVWCGQPNILFGCLNRRGAGGTGITYEVNGSNRSGGMTGWQRVNVLIRRVPDQTVRAPGTGASVPQ